MNKSYSCIETNLESIHDAVLKAGFHPGRRIRAFIEYMDAEDARQEEYQRLSLLLNRYPLPSEFKRITEEAAMKIANDVVDE